MKLCNNRTKKRIYQNIIHNNFILTINNSIKNTHSRNGLIKFNKSQYVYLGLENEGYDDDIYVTLEVVALIESTKYFKLVKK